MLKVSFDMVLNMSAHILKVPSILWIIHLKYKELKGQSVFIKYQEVLNVMKLHMSPHMFLISKIFEIPYELHPHNFKNWTHKIPKMFSVSWMLNYIHKVAKIFQIMYSKFQHNCRLHE